METPTNAMKTQPIPIMASIQGFKCSSSGEKKKLKWIVSLIWIVENSNLCEKIVATQVEIKLTREIAHWNDSTVQFRTRDLNLRPSSVSHGGVTPQFRKNLTIDKGWRPRGQNRGRQIGRVVTSNTAALQIWSALAMKHSTRRIASIEITILMRLLSALTKWGWKKRSDYSLISNF